MRPLARVILPGSDSVGIMEEGFWWTSLCYPKDENMKRGPE